MFSSRFIASINLHPLCRRNRCVIQCAFDNLVTAEMRRSLWSSKLNPAVRTTGFFCNVGSGRRSNTIDEQMLPRTAVCMLQLSLNKQIPSTMRLTAISGWNISLYPINDIKQWRACSETRYAKLHLFSPRYGLNISLCYVYRTGEKLIKLRAHFL